MSNEKPSIPGQPDLSELSGFHFGTTWLSQSQRPASGRPPRSRDDRRDSRPRQDRQDRREPGSEPWRSRPDRRNRDDRRPSSDAQNQGNDSRGPRRPRQDRRNFTRVEPVHGYQGEIRPIEQGLSNVAAEVHRHKRILSMFELAKLVMGARERYEVILSRQPAKEVKEGEQPQAATPEIWQCSKDSSAWLSRDEALAHVATLPDWLTEFYQPNLPEAPAAESEAPATPVTPSSWTVKRADAEAKTITSIDALVEDFAQHHFAEIFAVKDSIVLPGNIPGRLLSPAILSLLVRTTDFFRKHPAAMIAKLCQAMARYHLPIFRWQSSYHTGPARPRAIPADAKLSDRIEAIVTWVSQNTAQGTDVMIKALAGEDPATHPDWVADLLWLLEQGYLVIDSQKRCYIPKARQTPEEAAALAAQQAAAAEKSKAPKPQKSPAEAKAAILEAESRVEESETVATVEALHDSLAEVAQSLNAADQEPLPSAPSPDSGETAQPEETPASAEETPAPTEESPAPAEDSGSGDQNDAPTVQ